MPYPEGIEAYDNHTADLGADAQRAGEFAARVDQIIKDVRRYRTDSFGNDRASVMHDFENALYTALGDLCHQFNTLCSDGDVAHDDTLRRIENQHKADWKAALARQAASKEHWDANRRLDEARTPAAMAAE